MVTSQRRDVMQRSLATYLKSHSFQVSRLGFELHLAPKCYAITTMLCSLSILLNSVI